MEKAVVDGETRISLHGEDVFLAKICIFGLGRRRLEDIKYPITEEERQRARVLRFALGEAFMDKKDFMIAGDDAVLFKKAVGFVLEEQKSVPDEDIKSEFMRYGHERLLAELEQAAAVLAEA